VSPGGILDMEEMILVICKVVGEVIILDIVFADINQGIIKLIGFNPDLRWPAFFAFGMRKVIPRNEFILDFLDVSGCGFVNLPIDCFQVIYLLFG
jgi:hypothetical protein